MEKPSPPEPNDKKEPPQVNYMRYMGMAFQMGGTIFIGILLGQFLDKRVSADRPYFTMLFSVVFTGAAVYLAIKDFLKPGK